MAAIARPAPFVLKPLAGLYNPFAPSCSLLCNHPTDIDAKEIIKSAKDTLNIDAKNVMPTVDPMINLDVELNIGGEQLTTTNIYIPQVDSVPEELFRRYTETDSRPQTPAPTLVSGMTRLSTTRTRRCVTPDPIPTCQIKKTRLILDLRRSHSQETLSVYGTSPFYSDPPEIRIQKPPSSLGSTEDLKQNQTACNKQTNSKRNGSPKKGENVNDQNETAGDGEANEEEEDDGDEYIKRRGKKRRIKTRDNAKCPITFQASVDPETQVATIGPDSHNASARHSLAPEGGSPLEAPPEEMKKPRASLKSSSASLDINSFLTKEILKQLRRELDEVLVDSELNSRRRKALEEALKTVVKGKPACEELASLKKEMKIPAINVDLWISLPRTFTRSSAIFQLPMDSQIFDTMTPLEYLEENIKITSTRKLLYNCIFEKYRLELEDENDYERQLDSKSLKKCLDLVMGKPLSEEQFLYFKKLVEWKDDVTFGFKTCCGIFALCERVLSPQICELPDKKEDPCHEIETADFEDLDQKLEGREVNLNLKTILYDLKRL